MNYWLIPTYLFLAELAVASVIGFVLSGFKIRPLFFWLFAIASWVMTLLAWLLSRVIALFVDTNGNLPYLLHWFQTPDVPCWGAPFWKEQHPAYSVYQLCESWLRRNPAQGYDQFIKADVTMQTPVRVFGNLEISDGVYGAPIGGWFLIIGGGVFQFSAIIPTRFCCIDIGLGWRLDPIAKKYETKTLGALIATPARFFRLNSR